MEHTTAPSAPTANQLSGRAIGALFFTGFGAIWLTLALFIRQTLTVGLSLTIATVFFALLLTALWLLREAKHFPRTPENKAIGRTFNRINLMEWIAVAIVAFVFGKLHIDAYVTAAITAIVGIHLFPLARLFRYPMHNVTGAALVAWASLSLLLVPTEHLQGITAIGTGIILWISAAATLAIAIQIMRRSTHATTSPQNRLSI